MSVELLCIAGVDGYFKQLNPAWTKVLGWTLEELKARPFAELVHPDDRSVTGGEQQRLRMGGMVMDFENRYQTKEGSYRWLSWRASPAVDRGVIFVCRHDRASRELLVVTLWEDGEAPQVPRRFTDALKDRRRSG